MEVFELELRQDDGWLIDARGCQRRAKRSAGYEVVHDGVRRWK